MATFIDLEVIIPEVQIKLEEASVVLPTLTDLSSRVVKGSKTVNYPTLAPVEGQNVGIDADFATTEQDADYGDDAFDLSEKLGHFFKVNPHIDDQNLFDTVADQSEAALKAIAKQADKSMIAKLVAGAEAADNYAGSTSDVVADFLEMMKVLDDQNVPEDERSFVASNATIKALRTAVKDFIRFETDKNGVIGELYGVPVLKSNFSSVLTNDIMYHKLGAGYAWGLKLLLMKEPTSIGTKILYSISKMFGGKVTQGGKMVAIRKVKPV